MKNMNANAFAKKTLFVDNTLFNLQSITCSYGVCKGRRFSVKKNLKEFWDLQI